MGNDRSLWLRILLGISLILLPPSIAQAYFADCVDVYHHLTGGRAEPIEGGRFSVLIYPLHAKIIADGEVYETVGGYFPRGQRSAEAVQEAASSAIRRELALPEPIAIPESAALRDYVQLALSRTLLSKIGALLASGAFAALRDRMDPRKHNGGVFLGLNGVVVKSHGGTDAIGFATAVDVAIEMVRNDLVKKISTDVAKLHQLIESPSLPAAAEAT